jgi:hypothetical protein
MTANQQLERPIVMGCDKAFEQFGIPGVRRFAPACDLAELAGDTFKWTCRHNIPSVP